MNADGDRYRTQPMYSFKDAARYAGVSVGTVRNWLADFLDQGQNGPMVSFVQMIEIAVAARFRKSQGVKLAVVRQAYERAQERSGLRYPFADKKLEAIGGHIVEVIRGESYPSMDTPGLQTLPVLVEELTVQFEYQDRLAARWYPRGRAAPIVLDPRISAGRPVVDGRGITIDALVWRWKRGGDPIEFIARDFDLQPDVVERALQYAEGLAA